MSGPRLAIVVDTEEEFDWRAPFDRAATATRSVRAQDRAHRVYDALGIVPTYVIGYPIARDPQAAAYFRALREAGRAEIGAHLHPWVTPPHDEPVTVRNSYACNLDPALERAKIAALTDAIGEAVGKRPRIFKAGRYGFGPATAEILADLGYEIDCSFVPNASFTGDGGPDFRGTSEAPFWLDPSHDLLEIPLTNAYYGPLARHGPALARLYDNPHAARLRLAGLLSRSGLLTRARLSPEGFTAEQQQALLRAGVARGQSLFTLTYHSPSLAPGNTPYVRDEADLDAFLACIAAVLRFFRDALGGRFTTLSQVHRDLAAGVRHAAPTPGD